MKEEKSIDQKILEILNFSNKKMTERKVGDRAARVLRLLELISSTDELIQLHKQSGDTSSLKGNIHLKNKLVKELQSLLKNEYNILVKIDEVV